MTIVRSYSTVGEAVSARSALDAAGIDAWIGDENIVSVNWLASNAVGGVKVCVRPEDAEVDTALACMASIDPTSRISFAVDYKSVLSTRRSSRSALRRSPADR